MRRCDVFCKVVDNYGDIGVCWRLARQLAHEYDLAVRLWVDDLASFAKLCPQADVMLESQLQHGVEVRLWRSEFAAVSPAEIVIAAFACKLPESYIDAMAVCECAPVWINLEYLSAEDWVAGCHTLPSPHPRLPLTRYFFFPGFSPQTGGLLIEKNLLARRAAFQQDVAAQQVFWRGMGMDLPSADTLKISLFSYENAALVSLFDSWAQGAQAVLCLVPEGRIVPQVRAYFAAQENYERGNLQVRVLPFVAQEDYDTLLWACDVNFVRGEDSCVRAQWAGKPFVWQIYAQQDAVHWQKLQAFLQCYHAGLSDAASHALQALWQVWNSGGEVAGEWSDFANALAELNPHAQAWADGLSENNLALNLLDFCQKVGKIRAFEIDEQRT